MRLYDDHLELGERIEHTRFKQLRDHDHRPSYMDIRVVESESDGHAYLVARVECLDSPFDPEETDIAADTTEVVVCSCPQYHYRCSADFEVGENPPSEWGECKHVRECFREERAGGRPTGYTHPMTVEENPDDVAVAQQLDGTILVRTQDRTMRFTDYKEE